MFLFGRTGSNLNSVRCISDRWGTRRARRLSISSLFRFKGGGIAGRVWVGSHAFWWNEARLVGSGAWDWTNTEGI